MSVIVAIPVGVAASALGRHTRPVVPVDVYGVWWSPRAFVVRRQLAAADVLYRFVDIATRSGAAELARALGNAGAHSSGRIRRGPVVRIEGEWLDVPDVGELDAALRRHRLLAPQDDPHSPRG